MIPNFYYTPDILNYDFGPQHPLKPTRLRRTIELLGRYAQEGFTIGPPERLESDLLRVHTKDYVEAVKSLGPGSDADALAEYGFGRGDNPPFHGMFDASLAYSSATAAAAKAVRDGEELAFGIGGGLHHALARRASGFCIFDDPAVACHILREKFERVAYVDIDVHHGDGVQWIFYDDPSVLTCSIHESGRTLFPGTGFVDETGAELTSLNVPIAAYATGDVWLDALARTIIPALRKFKPGAIVLQMGTDAHVLDPLGHLRVTQQEWLNAVRLVQSLDIPLVALGGGGYNLTTVPRMWVSAVLTLSGITYDDNLPADLAEAWDMPTFSDPESPMPRGMGRREAEETIAFIEGAHLA
jgi:acetoin utilization protein AcuC